MLDDVDVLIVEEQAVQDTATLAEVFAQCRPRAHVWTAGGADQALEYLLARGEFAGRDDRSQPGLVVLEGPPRLDDALALLTMIRVLPVTSAVPVVIVTPDPNPETLRRCYDAGANSVVARSRDMRVMVNTMGTLHAFWSSVNETLYNRHDGAGSAFQV